MRHVWRAGLFALCASLAPAPGFAQQPAPQQITLAEARALAGIALQRGEPQLALNIAKGLLQANPKDPIALLIVANAQQQLGNPINGRRAAARAYRNADDDRLKLQAAQLAAVMALQAERPTLTQVWLRRASLYVNNPEDEARLSQDYARVRAANPWNFNVDFSVRPSSNLNNGANGDVQIVDGLEDLNPGRLNGSAQALSGVIAQAQVSVGYRLRQSERSRTDLRARALIRRVDLSGEARQILRDNITLGEELPDNGDFGSSYVDLTLQHGFRVGERPGDTARVSFGLGGSWYAGDHTASFARLEGQRRWQPDATRSYTLTGSISRRDDANTARQDSTTFGIQGRSSYVRDSGDRLSATFGLQKTVSDTQNRENTALSLQTRYQFAKAWGPATVSAGVTLQHVDFPTYVVAQDSAGAILAPGGRQDQSAYADLHLFFRDYDYAGFAPTVTVRAGKKSSNVSRFDTKEVSVSVGIRSKF